MIQKILRLFVNTLTADDKHYLLNRDNLAQLIHMQLSQKQKTFLEFFFFFALLKYILTFKHFPKKENLIADVFPEKLAAKNMVRQMSKKPSFRAPLDRQHDKWVDNL